MRGPVHSVHQTDDRKVTLTLTSDLWLVTLNLNGFTLESTLIDKRIPPRCSWDIDPVHWTEPQNHIGWSVCAMSEERAPPADSTLITVMNSYSNALEDGHKHDLWPLCHMWRHVVEPLFRCRSGLLGKKLRGTAAYRATRLLFVWQLLILFRVLDPF